MKKVVVVGSAIVDMIMRSNLFRILKSHEVEGGVALCEVYGGKMEIDHMEMAVGGAGTNVAVGLTRLGLLCAPIVCVGRDGFGKMIKNNLETEKVNMDLVQESEISTGISVVLVGPKGGRSIITYRGASAEIKSNDINWDFVSKVDWIHIASLGGDIGLLEDLVVYAAKKGIGVSINPGKKEITKREKLLELFPKIKIVILNRLEAADLTGEQYENWDEIIRKTKDWGVNKVAVTDGARGACIVSGGVTIKMSAFPLKSIDDTGAGDGFCSGVIAGVLEGKTDEILLKMGLANGGSEVTKYGAKNGLLRRHEIDRWLKKSLRVVSSTG